MRVVTTLLIILLPLLLGVACDALIARKHQLTLSVMDADSNEPLPSVTAAVFVPLRDTDCSSSFEIREHVVDGIGVTNEAGIATFEWVTLRICGISVWVCDPDRDTVTGGPACLELDGGLGREIVDITMIEGHRTEGELYSVVVEEMGPIEIIPFEDVDEIRETRP
jgi:hypothetical protein